MQISAERRFSAGLTFQVSYSYSHALNYISQNPGSGGATFTDTYDHKYDYGNSDFNIPQRFFASWNYLLPFHHDSLLHWAVNGWQVNGILSLYDGLPFTVLSATNTLNTGGGSHGEYVGSANGSLPSSQQSVHEWFNVSDFTTPPLLSLGDVGKNTLSGPPTRQLDAWLRPFSSERKCLTCSTRRNSTTPLPQSGRRPPVPLLRRVHRTRCSACRAKFSSL